MKQCPIDKNCYAFETVEEFNETFTRYAEREDKELNDNLCIEGNSGLNFDDVKNWVAYFGLENVYFEGVDGDFDCITTFYFDIKNAKHNGQIYLSRPDEISFYNGFLHIWFD